jgi:succinate dehydrogenase / fumarate reductase cytochrome b subunit
MSPNWLRWHTLLGAVPLAGYLLIHLLGQVLSLSGSPLQRKLQDLLERSPLALGLELALVYVPLAGHAALGVWRVAGRSPAVTKAGASDPDWPVPWGSALQRVSALALLVFLLLHVWQFEGRLWAGELRRADFFPVLCASLSSTALGGVPLVAIGYLLGIAAASVHLAQGLYHAGLSWGVVAPAGRERLGRACVLGGITLFAAGALIIVQLATGSVLPTL